MVMFGDIFKSGRAAGNCKRSCPHKKSRLFWRLCELFGFFPRNTEIVQELGISGSLFVFHLGSPISERSVADFEVSFPLASLTEYGEVEFASNGVRYSAPATGG